MPSPLFRLALASALIVGTAQAATAPPNEPAGTCTSQDEASAQARRFAADIDAGRYDEAWRQTTSGYRAGQAREGWAQLTARLAAAGRPQQRIRLGQRMARANDGSVLLRFDYEVVSPTGIRREESIAIGERPAGECGIAAYQVEVRRAALDGILDTFVGNVNRTGGHLDYSLESLIEIERLLMEHGPAGQPRHQLTRGSDYRAVIYLLGQYLGEVLIRQRQATWSHAPSPGNRETPWVVLPSGQRIDAIRLVTDYARQPTIGGLREGLARLLADAPQAP
jgi:hypothetical protein